MNLEESFLERIAFPTPTIGVTHKKTWSSTANSKSLLFWLTYDFYLLYDAFILSCIFFAFFFCGLFQQFWSQHHYFSI